MSLTRRGSFCVIAGMILVGLGWVPAKAQVLERTELFLQPSSDTINLNENPFFGVSMIVRSTVGVNLPISGLTAILNWDPAKVQFQGINNNGPYNWLASTLPNDSAFDGLNQNLNDGNAFYQAQSNFFPNVAIASTSGLLVTTLVFRALAETPGTTIVMPLTQGVFSETLVVSGTVPGANILVPPTGSATIRIVPEPATAGLLLFGGLLAFRRNLRMR